MRAGVWVFILCAAGLLGYAALDAESEQRRPVADPGELASGESAVGESALGAEKTAAQSKTAAERKKAERGTYSEADRITARLRQTVAELPAAEVAGEVAAARVSSAGRTADWPAVAAAADGALWTAYIEWDGEDADRVVVRRRGSSTGDGAGERAGAWGEPVVVGDAHGDHYIPAIAAIPGGALAVWSAQTGGQFELFAAVVSGDGHPGRVERLTRAPHGDINVRAASDAAGNVTIAWQSFRDGQSDIYVRRWSDFRWGPEVKLSTSIANDWEPAIALDSTGRAWVSWDSYHAGNYDIFLASFDGTAASAPVAMTSGERTSFHSAVAVDGNDRVWVAWDEARKNWGKDFATSSRLEGSEGLHARRNLRVRVYANGRIFEPAADINEAFTGRMTQFAELPTIAIDGNATPQVVFRHWTLTKPTEMFHFYATKLTASGWSKPWLLANSSGRNTQRAPVVSGPGDSVMAVYSSDGRSPDNLPQDQTHAQHYNVYLASLPESAPSGAIALNQVDVPAPVAGFAPRERATMTLDGKTYTLLLGDCHRHTDIRGHSGVDGSLEDTYRYAMDAAQMDFVGPSDHNEVMGGTWPDGLRDYQWWVAQKLVDVMTHAPRFWGIYTYEHSMDRPGGHRNMLFLKRGAPMRGIDRRRDAPEPDNQPPALWEWVEKNVLSEAGQKTVIVPHTFAAGPLADWNWPNAPFDCLLEIYQGARGSYERWRLPAAEKRGPTQTDEPGHFAQDALNNGNIYGFVSFSDHRSTHNSWAAVWVEELRRESLFDAMLARRTFGASDEIIARASAGPHMPGEQFTLPVAAPIEIKISVEAPDEILRVDVIKNGEYVYTQRPGGRAAELRYRDNDSKKGKSYYYVRVFQRDTENPSGDPEIAWASPFFVTYE